MNKGILDVHVWVECPKCEKDFDLLDGDDGTYLEPLFDGKWDYFDSLTVHCEHCGHEFELEKVEW